MTRRLVSPSLIGKTNRSRVLKLLFENGPSSRAQLARALGVNRATIASILQPLVDDGTLIEGEAIAPSRSGGKPARPLWFNQAGAELGSVRMSSTRILAARIGMDGTIRTQGQRQIGPDWELSRIRDELLTLADECFEGHVLFGIGVAAAGMVDTTTGRILSVHLAPVLNGFAVVDELQAAFAVPVAIDHHPRVLALGDRWFGAGRGLERFASVYTGEALGIGFVHEGEVFRGVDGAGGEYGHMVVDMRGDRCMCGRTGCWETIATTGWLRAEAGRRGLPDAERADCASLVAAAGQGDARAAGLIRDYARNLAVGMANHEHMLASHNYIIHGDAATGGETMRALLQEYLAEFSPHRGEPPVVIVDPTDEDPVLLGGGGLVLSTELSTVV
ncbi:ROK family protein [Kribbella karoonensis]|uniref:ROK family protein n=2 Tax=Kribbellaceae TaxID=2726069 RepID=A0ABP4QG17_9ACTN